jgi:hypothetical protein
MQNVDHNIGFWEKRQFFLRKLAKIAENWRKSQKIVIMYNIDPWSRHYVIIDNVFFKIKIKISILNFYF